MPLPLLFHRSLFSLRFHRFIYVYVCIVFLFRFVLLFVIVFAVTFLSNTKCVCVFVEFFASNPLALFFFYFCFFVITFHLDVKMYVIQSISTLQHALMIRLQQLSSRRAKARDFFPLSFVRSSVCGKKIMNFTNFTPFTVACLRLRCNTEFLHMNQIKQHNRINAIVYVWPVFNDCIYILCSYCININSMELVPNAFLSPLFSTCSTIRTVI